MKDYEVNYVHQESKTIPDTNYTFETAMMPARLPKHEAPPTHKDVLLKRWAQDTEAMAKRLIGYSSPINYFTADHDGQTVYYKTFKEAVAGEIAYLNSTVEGATK